MDLASNCPYYYNQQESATSGLPNSLTKTRVFGYPKSDVVVIILTNVCDLGITDNTSEHPAIPGEVTGIN